MTGDPGFTVYTVETASVFSGRHVLGVFLSEDVARLWVAERHRRERERGVSLTAYEVKRRRVVDDEYEG